MRKHWKCETFARSLKRGLYRVPVCCFTVQSIAVHICKLLAHAKRDTIAILNNSVSQVKSHCCRVRMRVWPVAIAVYCKICALLEFLLAWQNWTEPIFGIFIKLRLMTPEFGQNRSLAPCFWIFQIRWWLFLSRRWRKWLLLKHVEMKISKYLAACTCSGWVQPFHQMCLLWVHYCPSGQSVWVRRNQNLVNPNSGSVRLGRNLTSNAWSAW